jgi:hypothetical protein
LRSQKITSGSGSTKQQGSDTAVYLDVALVLDVAVARVARTLLSEAFDQAVAVAPGVGVASVARTLLSEAFDLSCCCCPWSRSCSCCWCCPVWLGHSCPRPLTLLLLSPLSVDVAVASEGSKMYWMVQRTDLWASEEILILLHHAGENEFSRKELGKYGMHDPRGSREPLRR